MAKTIRSPTTAVSNWVSRASNAASFWLEQVDKSAWKVYAASDKAEANYNAAMTKVLADKTRQKACAATDDTVWKSGVKAVGASGYSSGVARAEPKMAAVMSKLIPDIEAIVKAMKPRGVRGSAENKDRMMAIFDGLSKNRGKYKATGVAKKAS
ncbi:MAG: hypothetical protein QXK24_02095 [Ignisphaera sp.]